MKEIRKCFTVSFEEIREKFDLPKGKMCAAIVDDHDETKELEVEIEVDENE